jgi:hypothetical protein
MLPAPRSIQESILDHTHQNPANKPPFFFHTNPEFLYTHPLSLCKGGESRTKISHDWFPISAIRQQQTERERKEKERKGNMMMVMTLGMVVLRGRMYFLVGGSF